mmetsp:Transcript_24838/g.54278  ORF Transcript_24838/g.54278 Transcript_24838/m.54278 type:complete len:227 (-) Transcript_24838:904-1584(-)
MTRCSSLSTACARPLWWNGTHMERRSTKKTASSMWIAIVQRSGEKSRGWRAPIGKFSSALSGWSNRSTSSMIRQPPRKSVSTCTSARMASSITGCCLRLWSRSSSIFSSILSWSDLMVLAVASTTPRLRAARRSFSTVGQRISDERSNERVKTRLRTMEEKAARSVAFDCSSSAGGIVCSTSVRPSARSNASSGPTTVVLPPPMSICFTSGLPSRTASVNSRTSST